MRKSDDMGKKKNKKKKKKEASKVTTTKHTWNKASCHSGQGLVHTVRGIDIYAGGINRSGGWHVMNPLPDLAMGPSETLRGSSKTVVPEGWNCGNLLPSPPYIVSLDFPDFGTPKVSAEFWYVLVEDILSNDIKSVSCQCAGGHGRTGVQLAILSYLLADEKERERWPDASSLIKWVRDIHCEHAVETKSQQTYIATVCQIPEGKSVIVERYWSGNNYHGWSGGGGSGKGTTWYDDKKTLADTVEDVTEEVGYCHTCDLDMMVTSDNLLCEYCGDDLSLIEIKVKEKKSKEEICPVCDSVVEDLVTLECQMCKTDILYFEDIQKSGPINRMMCRICTDSYDTTEMVEDKCRMCHAESIGMKSNWVDMKLKCETCNRYVPEHKFFAFHDATPECAPCTAGGIDKKEDTHASPENDDSPFNATLPPDDVSPFKGLEGD